MSNPSPDATSLRVRKAVSADVGRIADIHEKAFGGFFLTSLGLAFLRSFYSAVLADPSSILLVAELEQRVVGFVAGYRSEREFYRRLRRKPIRIGSAIFLQVLWHPSLLVRIWSRYQETSEHARAQPQDAVYLASIGVDPACAGGGVGANLAEAFCTAAAASGYREVYLTTDADSNEKVNRFYKRLGFHIAHEFTTLAGRRMNEFRKATLP